MPLFKADKKPSRGPAGRWDVVISEDMCKACGFCLAVCPVDVFAWRKTPNRLTGPRGLERDRRTRALGDDQMRLHARGDERLKGANPVD